MGILCDVVLLLHRRNVRIIQLSTRAGNVRIVQFNEQVMYNVLDNSWLSLLPTSSENIENWKVIASLR